MLNNVVLMGRLVADPELKTTQSGLSVTSFTIAVNRAYVKDNAEQRADFIDIVAWRKTAEFITKYFSKGSMIAIQGSIQTRIYEDKNGNKRKAVEIIAEKVSFCGSKNEVSANQSAGGQANQADFTAPNLTDDDLPF